MRDAVLVAGIGGASLGTEILKSLALADRYTVYGCDISPLAYGHFNGLTAATHMVPRDGYVEAVLDLCRRYGIQVVIPGGEGPLALFGRASDACVQAGVHVAANTPEVIRRCSDKQEFFTAMASLNLPIPRTTTVAVEADLDAIGDLAGPLVVKPATGTGGSRFVFLCASPEEAMMHARHLLSLNVVSVVQEYISVDEGEFTIGVLSLPTGNIVGSVAMRRVFHTKLSVSMESEIGLISSGYSQGLIEEFPDLCAQAEMIASRLGSCGPINIQARVQDGVLVPFEANPRFSASTYLRALAGFNEIDIYIRWMLHNEVMPRQPLKAGYYLRSLTEVFVPNSEGLA